MHESILVYRRRRYLWIALALAVVAIAAYALQPSTYPANGGTWLGYTLGAVATLLILWLTAFGIRKRRYRSTLGSLEGWLSAHVYLGAALLLVATLHCGFQFGLNVHTLAYVLMLATIASGAYGVYAYLRYPSLVSRNRGNMTLEQMLDNVATIDAQCLRIARRMPDDIREVVTSAFNRTTVGGGVRAQLGGRDASRVVIPAGDGDRERVARNPDQETAIDWLARRQAQTTDGELGAALDELGRLFAGKRMMLRKVRADIRMQARLQFWLYLHVPLAVALLAALAAHIVSVFTYW